jgi:D-alanyl-D-alanine dipeptidase
MKVGKFIPVAWLLIVGMGSAWIAPLAAKSPSAAGSPPSVAAVEKQQEKVFQITPLKPIAELRREALAAKPPVEAGPFLPPDFVDVTTYDPNIKLEIRYATSRDFLGAPVYSEARAFLQRPAAEALARASRKLRALGYGLLIYDAYRPWYVTKMFWDATPADKKIFVANPAEGSRHNRGCAVDLTLYDLKTGSPVEMTGGYDEMSERSYATYAGGTALQRSHRELLKNAMQSEGFDVFPFEWWHFDFRSWQRYPILNLTFEQLDSSQLSKPHP